MSKTEQRSRVLVIEDEASIRRGLCDVLTFRGFEVEPAEDGTRGLACMLQGRHDLVVLDVMLPGIDGFSLCREARAKGVSTPVLMLTAKGAEDDVLRGFELGADDYVTKPFSVRELLARVEALLRRSRRVVQEAFFAGPFRIDPARATASVNGHEVELSAREVRILRLLSEEPGRIISRRNLLCDAWEMKNAEQIETRTVDMHIAKLRKKLGAAGEGLVETVRGQGYRLCDPPR